MKERFTLAACIALLLAAFVFDMLTPQALVAAILLTIPVGLSSLLLDRALTMSLVVAALASDAVAGWYNGAAEGHHWSAIAIANRVLAAFSILLVGLLGTLAQGAAQRSGQLVAEQRQRAREQTLRKAMETVRSSLNVELVARAIVHEAAGALGVDEARLYTIENHRLAETTFSWQAGNDNVTVSRERPSAELASLLQRCLSERRLVAITQSDALGRFALATLGAARAACVPLVNEQMAFGALLLVSRKEQRLGTDLEPWIQVFAEQATVAAAQASLFVELGDRNSELARANATLQRRGDVIRDLVYALSHDLRTPLSSAAMTMQQALEGVYGPLPERYLEILRHSVASNDELRRLAETLLLVARYESGERSNVTQRVDLLSLAHSVVAELEPLWQAKNVACTVSGDGDGLVPGDEGELRRAVTNLVSNAINWTPRTGHVRVEVLRDGDRVATRVEDDGYGVAPEARDRLFQRFATGEQPRQGAGCGLGLYLVRLVACSHGGNARYEERSGGGSRFTMELPAAPQTGRTTLATHSGAGIGS